MLAYHRCPVCLSFISPDLPIWSVIETAATLYQKDQNRFHILLSEISLQDSENLAHLMPPTRENEVISSTSRQLLWLEISPQRVIMTMQGKDRVGYRHFWEQGVYGMSRYWLNSSDGEESPYQRHTTQPQTLPLASIRLRNYTHLLKIEGNPIPNSLRIEYELWTNHLQLGNYILHLELHH